MKKILIFIIFIFVLIFPVLADDTATPEAGLTPWADVWANASYYKTNGENSNFRGMLLRSEGRFGLSAGAGTITPYFVYYGVTGQDPNYWNNNLATGFGVRVTPFSGIETKNWATEWIRDVKLYGEILSLTFLKDDKTAIANKVKTDDLVYGVDIWHEWNLNNIDRKYFWAELWTRVSYRNTNFYDPYTMDKFQTYIGFLQLKIGRHLAGSIMPYITADLSLSGSKAVWLNSLYYGLGLRMEPFLDQDDAPAMLKKFKMFVEYLKIDWLADQDPTRPTSDLRFGIELTYGR